MNPARWFGPAVVYGDLSQAVVYIAGPLIGATLAALSVRYLSAQR
jgi:aquaporin TIP